jgi:hypothetical protein
MRSFISRPIAQGFEAHWRMDDRNHQTFRHGAGLRSSATQMGRDRLYNVAKLGFEWSLFIERLGRRGRPRLAAVSRDWQASQFVTGDSVSSQDLMPHRRPNVGSPADGGAHGPTHGSPSAGAGIVRSDKARSTASDRGLRPSCADSSAHEPAAERRRCPIIQSKNIKGGGIGR